MTRLSKIVRRRGALPSSSPSVRRTTALSVEPAAPQSTMLPPGSPISVIHTSSDLLREGGAGASSVATPIRHYEREALQRREASLRLHRVCAHITFDDEDAEPILFVCAASTLPEFVLAVRMNYGLQLGKRAATKWTMAVHSFVDNNDNAPVSDVKLTSERFRACVSQRTGWNPTHLRVWIKTRA